MKIDFEILELFSDPFESQWKLKQKIYTVRVPSYPAFVYKLLLNTNHT